MRNQRYNQWGWALAAALSVSLLPTQAAVTVLNFNTDPALAGVYTEPGVTSALWRPDGGANADGTVGGAGNGYLSITDAINAQRGVLFFKDLENKKIIKSFVFEAQLRIGGGTDRPADGFSLNYASISDPLLVRNDGNGWAGTDNEGGADVGGGGLPEEGSTTGLAIGFDTWQSFTIKGVQDVVGISVRVDNALVVQFPVPLVKGNAFTPNLPNPGAQGAAYTYDEVPYRNLPSTDPNYAKSMQTGPQNPERDPDNDAGVADISVASWGKLRWETFKASIDEDAKLEMFWKGLQITPDGGLQTAFSPQAGRIILGGRTGGANENHHIDNITLNTVPNDKILVGNSVAFVAQGFNVVVSDSGDSIFNPNSAQAGNLTVLFDGADVTSQVTKTKVDVDGVTTIAYRATTLLASASEHTVSVTAKDSTGFTASKTSKFKVPTYQTIDPALRLAAAATGSGFKVRTAQTPFARYPGDVNLLRNAEHQAAGGYVGADGSAQPNTSATVEDITTVEIVNWNQDGDANVGNFSSAKTDAPYIVPETTPPGIPGSAEAEGGTAHFVTVATTFLHLKAGFHRLGVNSDDGFRVSVASGAGDVFGTVLGVFNGGRGASDTLFDFAVTEEGDYPFRLSFWEGGGGANCEFFSVDINTGVKYLINQRDGADGATGNLLPQAIKASANGNGGSYIGKFAPWPNQPGIEPKASIQIELIDGSPAIDKDSIVLELDGAAVTPVKSTSGTKTTVTFAPPGGAWGYDTRHQGILTYKLVGGTEPRIVSYSFRVRPTRVSEIVKAGAFNIEAEQFDHNSGKTALKGSVVTGEEYSEANVPTLPVHDVDYRRTNNELNGNSYRIGETPNVPMDQQNTGTFSNNQTQGAQDLKVLRPSADGSTYELIDNYKLGWAGTGNWLNFTRDIPKGKYNVYAGLSYDGGDLGQLSARLQKVVAGQGTTTQTVQDVGSFRGYGSGGWGNTALIRMNDASGNPTVLFIGDTTTTLRFNYDSGDFDFMTLVPATGAPLAKPVVRSASPAPGSTVSSSDSKSFVFDILNQESKVDTTSVKLTIDGVNIPVTVTPTALGAGVTASTGDGLKGGQSHSYALSFQDDQGNTIGYGGSFIVNILGSKDQFVIEAEDFNFDNGGSLPIASVMPYLGNAYDGKSAVQNVDYRRSFDEGAEELTYRKGEDPNVPMNENAGYVSRGSWSVTKNYKIGWADGDGWYNYTRSIPSAKYEVWAGLSHGETGATAIQGKLETVTSGASTSTQTVDLKGTFSAAGTGGWGVNTLVQLKNADGSVAYLNAGGTTVLRVSVSSGDYDYIVLVPVGPQETSAKINSITLNAAGKVIIEFVGILQATSDLNLPFATVADATSPLEVGPTLAARFYRAIP